MLVNTQTPSRVTGQRPTSDWLKSDGDFLERLSKTIVNQSLV